MINKKEFIQFMTESGVLTFGDFIAKSGRKTPYFVNTGNYRTGEHITKLGEYYAKLIKESEEQIDALYGPAYKGITIASAAAGALYRLFGIDKPFFYNRKEEKDHGEGGTIIGYTPQDGDRIGIVEDVVTAGTAVRESLDLLKRTARVEVTALYVSVDRMERGTGTQSALEELQEEYGIKTYPIITVRDIIESLDEGDARIMKLEEYIVNYGVVTR